MNARARVNTGSASRTREQLLLAGERLFAERGIDGVSLRQINASAGQRNSSASHYHFGSKDALIRSIYAYRADRIDAGRRARLAMLRDEGRAGDVRSLVEALVLPVHAEITGSEGGRNFIRFLAQLVGHPMIELKAMMRAEFAGSVGEVYRALRAALPGIPEEVFTPRFGLAWDLGISALSDLERLQSGPAEGGGGACSLTDLFLSNLIDSLVGLLSVPVSPGAERRLAELRQCRKCTP